MSSKNISFDSIPSTIRKPGKYAEFNTALAVRTLPANRQRVLIIGQRTASGTVAEKIVKQVYSDKEAETCFGAGSQAHLMARAAITANPYLDLSVVALNDAGAGVAAAGTLTITGPASSAGTLTAYIGSQKVEVAIAKDDTATVIGDALVAKIAAKPDLPVTAANALGTVTITAKNKGLCGNQIGLAYDLAGAAGVAVAVVAMAGGATNPGIQDALTAVFAEQYHLVVTPFNNQTDLVTLKTHLDSVSGALEKRPATAFYGFTDALASATTLGGQVNHGRTGGPYLRYTAATKRRSLPSEIAAAFAAVKAGVEDPAQPLNGLELPGIAVPDIADRLSRTEQETCLYNGVLPLEVGLGEKVRIVRAISTYVKDAQGVDDISLLDLTTIWTLDYASKAFTDRISLRFPRSKKTVRVKSSVKSELLDVAYKLQDLEIIENVDENKNGFLVEDDLQDPNRLNARIPVDVVNGLHVYAQRIDLYL